ncbi:DUF2207 domain-containing protein [Alkalicoccus chagannorensis]|uniref:DUF2207 domain-containing protein n=1 Tax=Alkalicoccus chagannorensis TaxID=427072 RepID=UPI0004272228|nr:DUF2207 domain-containing protein [Alkalicoccus chagannorensis]
MKKGAGFCFGLLIWFVWSSPAAAFELTIPEAQIDVYLQEDGTAQVEESFTYEFEGDFNGVIRDLIEPEGSTIFALEASEDGEPLDVEVEGDSEYRIQRPGEDEMFTVDITYTIEDAVVRYDDFGDFFHAFFDHSNETAYENLMIRVQPPGDSSDVIIEGFDALEGAGSLEEDHMAVFDPGRVPSGENGDIRAAFDAELFPDAQRTSDDSLEAVLEEEREEAAAAAAAAENRAGLMAGAAPFLIGFFALASLLPIWIDRRKYLPNKQRALAKSYEKGAPELQMSLPATMFYVQPAVTSELLTASLLDLVRQGYAEQEDADRFRLIRREGMNGHEQMLTAMLFDDMGDGETFRLTDMEECLKQEKQYHEFEKKKIDWYKEILQEKNEAALKIPRTGLRILCSAVGILAIAAAVPYFIFGLLLPAGLLTLVGLAGITAAALHQPRTEKGWRLLGEWHDFKKEVAAYEQEDWKRLDPEEQRIAFIYGLGLNVKSVRELSKSMPKMKDQAVSMQADNSLPVFMTAGLFASTQFSSHTAAASNSFSSTGTSAGGGAGAGGGGGGSGGF